MNATKEINEVSEVAKEFMSFKKQIASTSEGSNEKNKDKTWWQKILGK